MQGLETGLRRVSEYVMLRARAFFSYKAWGELEDEKKKKKNGKPKVD